jgi:hypothetical protein
MQLLTSIFTIMACYFRLIARRPHNHSCSDKTEKPKGSSYDLLTDRHGFSIPSYQIPNVHSLGCCLPCPILAQLDIKHSVPISRLRNLEKREITCLRYRFPEQYVHGQEMRLKGLEDVFEDEHHTQSMDQSLWYTTVIEHRKPPSSLALSKASNQPSSQRTKETVEFLRCARQDERTRQADGTIGLFISSIVWVQRLCRRLRCLPPFKFKTALVSISFPRLDSSNFQKKQSIHSRRRPPLEDFFQTSASKQAVHDPRRKKHRVRPSIPSVSHLLQHVPPPPNPRPSHGRRVRPRQRHHDARDANRVPAAVRADLLSYQPRQWEPE